MILLFLSWRSFPGPIFIFAVNPSVFLLQRQGLTKTTRKPQPRPLPNSTMPGKEHQQPYQFIWLQPSLPISFRWSLLAAITVTVPDLGFGNNTNSIYTTSLSPNHVLPPSYQWLLRSNPFLTLSYYVPQPPHHSTIPQFPACKFCSVMPSK